MSPKPNRKTGANPRPTGVPLYSASNELVSFISHKRATQLEREGRTRVVRARDHKAKDGTVIRGEIKCVYFYRRPDEPKAPVLSQYIGQKYSEQETLPHLSRGQRPWRFKRLGRGNELRPIFLRVVTDCLVEAHA